MPDARGDGYVDDIPYTHGYQAAMNPRVMQWTLVRAGYRPPEVRSACELGFGQGVSLAIHGSVGAAAWQGTDFNSAHARNARALCEDCEPRPRIYAESFAECFARSDLAPFDFYCAACGVELGIARESSAARAVHPSAPAPRRGALSILQLPARLAADAGPARAAR